MEAYDLQKAAAGFAAPGRIFDSHAHYDADAFHADRDTVLQSLYDRGVGRVLNCGSDLASSEKSLGLAEQYDWIYAAVGVHPEEIPRDESGAYRLPGASDRAALEGLAAHPKALAMGEIGLDYYWDTCPPREIQRAWLAFQLELAAERGMPVVIHDREAHGDTLELLQKYRPAGVVHCFSGSPEMAAEVVKLGMYVGLGGAATFKNARKAVEVAAMLPADRLLLETDAPYMAPVPFRGKRCDSALIAYTAARLAEIRGETPETLIARCRENACRMLGLPDWMPPAGGGSSPASKA